jgi:hypothetical protein
MAFTFCMVSENGQDLNADTRTFLSPFHLAFGTFSHCSFLTTPQPHLHLDLHLHFPLALSTCTCSSRCTCPSLPAAPARAQQPKWYEPPFLSSLLPPQFMTTPTPFHVPMITLPPFLPSVISHSDPPKQAFLMSDFLPEMVMGPDTLPPPLYTHSTSTSSHIHTYTHSLSLYTYIHTHTHTLTHTYIHIHIHLHIHIKCDSCP